MSKRKIFAAILTAIFFAMSFSADAATSADKKNSAPVKKSVWQAERKIGHWSGVSQITFQMSEPCVMIDPDTKKILQKIDKDKPFTIDFASMKTAAVEVRGEKVDLKDLQVAVNGKKYFGGVRVNKNRGALTVINLIPVE